MKTLIASIVIASCATAAQACDALALGVGCYSQPIRQQVVVQRYVAQPVVQYQAVPVIQQQVVDYYAQPIVQQQVIQKQRVVQRQKIVRQRVKVRAPLIQRQKIVQRNVVY